MPSGKSFCFYYKINRIMYIQKIKYHNELIIYQIALLIVIEIQLVKTTIAMSGKFIGD
jgi:hypothetical protein